MKFKIAPCKDHSKHDHAGLICFKIRHKNTGAEVLDGEIMAEFERLEAELAKREKALEEAWNAIIVAENKYEALIVRLTNSPFLDEWHKQRNRKDEAH